MPNSEERLVTAFERIADALTGIHEIERRKYDKQWPERTPRDAVVSRIPTDEDRIREAHGSNEGGRIEEWLEPAWIGDREREFLSQQASAENAMPPKGSGPSGRRPEAPEGENDRP